MKYLLDTDILSDLERPSSSEYANIFQKFCKLPDDTKVYYSILSIYEMQYGASWAKRQLDKQLIAQKMEHVIKSIQSKFDLATLDTEGAVFFAEMKAEYREKSPISPTNIKKYDIDLMLASTAINLGAILVSRDHIFEGIQKMKPNFLWENWI